MEGATTSSDHASSGDSKDEGEAANEDSKANPRTNTPTPNIADIAQDSLAWATDAYNFCNKRLRGLDSADSVVQVTCKELRGLRKAARVTYRSITDLTEALAEANRNHEEAGDVDADAALRAAITTYQPTKKFELHFTALITATCSPDVRCEPLTADSERPTVKKACEMLAVELGKVRRLPKELKARRETLQSLLAYPPPQLVDAFIAALSSQGDRGVEMAFKDELAARRVDIVSGLIRPAAAPAHVKQKDLFRRLRDEYPSAWVASCGTLLAKANAALDTLTADGRATGQVPPSVVAKWQEALIAVHGEGCEFKPESQGTHQKIKCAHIYRFELS